MKKSKQIFRLLIMVSILGVFFAGCSKKEDNKIKAEPVSENTIENSNENKKENSDNLNKKITSSKTQEKERKLLPSSEIGVVRQADLLLYHTKKSVEIFYNDFEIGELQDKDDLYNEKDIEMFMLAEEFLNNLKKKKIEEEMLIPYKSEFIKNNIKRWFETIKIENFRIGRLVSLVDTPFIDFRLLSGGRYYEGTIYFIYEKEIKIFDLQMDMSIINTGSGSKRWKPQKKRE